MQNNNKSNHFWKEKGPYILLALCLVAVGVSGWFFFSGAMDEAEELQPVLSVPVEVEEPAKEQTKDKPAAADTEVKKETKTPAEPQPEEETRQTVLPVSGDVLRNYAMDKLTYNATTKDWRVHSGVDLAAEPGTTVKAAKAGTVADVYEDDYYGTTVAITHDGGYTSYYSNLDAAVLVEAGQTVSAGDAIGSIGTTALMESAEDSHLHFSVYCGGQPVDPAGFLY